MGYEQQHEQNTLQHQQQLLELHNHYTKKQQLDLLQQMEGLRRLQNAGNATSSPDTTTTTMTTTRVGVGAPQLLPPPRYGSKREQRNIIGKAQYTVATNAVAAEYNKAIDAYTTSRMSPTKKPKRTAAVESSSRFVQNLVAQSFAVTAKAITQRHEENDMEAADNDDDTPQVITSNTTPTYVDVGTTLINHKKRKTIKVEDTDDDDDDDTDDDSSLVF